MRICPCQLQHNQKGTNPEPVTKGHDLSGITNIIMRTHLDDQYTIRSEVVLCPLNRPPQKNSIAQYSMVLDNVMTADANPITGADGYDDMCAKYT